MVLLSGTLGGQLTRISVFALKTSTGGESKDRSNQDPDDEPNRLLERGGVELKGGHPLREGGRERQTTRKAGRRRTHETREAVAAAEEDPGDRRRRRLETSPRA